MKLWSYSLTYMIQFRISLVLNLIDINQKPLWKDSKLNHEYNLILSGVITSENYNKHCANAKQIYNAEVINLNQFHNNCVSR